MKKLATLALAAALIAPSVSAADNNINAWKQCGIGAMIFDQNGVAAAISNIIWDLGTTAVTSKLSSAENCNSGSAKTAMFIKQSYKNIIEETAQGEGEYITAMLDLLEVSEENRVTTIAAVRNDMARLVSEDSYASKAQSEKAELYYNSLIVRAQ